MADNNGILPLLGLLLDAALYGRHDTPAYAQRIAGEIGLGEVGGPGAAERLLGEALGLTPNCRCGITLGAPAEVIPPACPVHGVPCDECGGTESCAEDCGEAAGDPVGTVPDLRSQAPRTVTRDGGHLVIPAVRLDAEGGAVLRQVINNEIADLAAGRAAP